jgi:predicted alpha/beta-fold hydrolase
MPVFKNHAYSPPLFLRSGHLNTIYPYLFRKDPEMPYQRKRLEIPDGDFIDVDSILRGNSRLAILCHGLEGSAHSKYIKYTALLLSKEGWDVVALNYRGCSGEMNRKVQMYHSGFTDDLHFSINYFENPYKEIGLVGFSLGANILMKYLGESTQLLNAKIKGAIGISVPCDLSAGASQIGQWYNYFYEKRFLITLEEKIKLKKRLFPDEINLEHLSKIKSLRDFDEFYTGPLHGYKDAEDYYQKAHCKQFLSNIQIPTLIINALDDPFLPEESYPFLEAKSNPNLGFIPTSYGGHVGFSLKGSKFYWEEQMIAQFLDCPSTLFDLYK